MKKKLLHWWLVIFMAVVTLTACGWFSNQPAHWDETAYLDGARKIAAAGGFPFTEFWSYKPPVFFELGAGLLGLFGEVRWPFRMLIAVIYLSTIWLMNKLTYLFLSDWQKADQKPLSTNHIFLLSWLVALVFALVPVVLGQALLYQPELWLIMLWLLIVWLYVERRWIAYWWVASLLVLSKEPAVFYILVVGVVHFYDRRHLLANRRSQSTRKMWQELIIIFSPLFWFASWLVGNKLILGWWLWPFNLQFFTSQTPYAANITAKLLAVFIDNQQWWLTLVSLIGLGLIVRREFFSPSLITKKQTHIWQKIFLLIGLGAITQLVFSLWGAFIPRYVLAVYTFLGLGLAVSLWYLMKWQKIWAIVLAMCGLGLFSWHEAYVLQHQVMSGWARDQDLRHQTVKQNYSNLYRWWQIEHSEKIMFSDWLAMAYFIDPLYGYVSQPAQVQLFKNCDEVVAVNLQNVMLVGSVDKVVEPDKNPLIICAAKLGLWPEAVFGPIVVYTAKDAQTSNDCGDFCQVRSLNPLSSDCGVAGVCRPSDSGVGSH